MQFTTKKLSELDLGANTTVDMWDWAFWNIIWLEHQVIFLKCTHVHECCYALCQIKQWWVNSTIYSYKQYCLPIHHATNDIMVLMWCVLHDIIIMQSAPRPCPLTCSLHPDPTLSRAVCTQTPPSHVQFAPRPRPLTCSLHPDLALSHDLGTRLD